MKKTVPLLLLLIIILQLSACEILHAVRSDVIQDIDQMIQDEQYDLAESLLLRVRLTHPQYNQVPGRLKKVQNLIMAYESKTMREAKSLESRHDWQAVIALYQAATKKLPNSMILLRSSDAALSRYHTTIDKAKGQALMNKSKLIANDHLTYKSLLELNPADKSLQLNVLRNQQDADIVARDLITLGERAAVRQQYDDAIDYFTAAYQLTSSEAIKVRIGTLPKKITTKKATVQSSKLMSANSKLDNYRAAIGEGDLLTAQKYMDELWVLDSANEEVQILQAQLQREVEIKIRDQSRLAEQLYSQGEYEQARDTWKSILPLDPENVRIKSDIDRTERVLANIQEIRNRQPR